MNVIPLSSEDGTAKVYACGACGCIYGKGTQSTAEACCVCIGCGGEVPKGGPYNPKCEACKTAEREKRAAERAARLLALPVVDDDGGPVYCESFPQHNGGYFTDLETAASTIWDSEEDPIDWANLIVHPCIVSKAGHQDLVQVVEEGWYECFEDGTDGLSQALTDELREIEKKITAEAPTVWNPNTKVRVAIAAPPEAAAKDS